MFRDLERRNDAASRVPIQGSTRRSRRREKRVRGVLVLAAALASACKPIDLDSASGDFYVAVGAQGDLPDIPARCTGDRAAPAGILRFAAGNTAMYDALAPGDVHVPCTKGAIDVHVRPIARLEIELPALPISAGDAPAFRPIARDADGHVLFIGAAMPIAWKFSGALTERPAPGCEDMIPMCWPANGGYALAEAEGKGGVEAKLAGAAASVTVLVGPRRR